MRVLKFSAIWCGPCKMLAPIFHKISEMEEFKNVSFEEIDVDSDDEESNELISKFEVRNLPTIVILNENNELSKRIVGSLTEANLVQVLRDTLQHAE